MDATRGIRADMTKAVLMDLALDSQSVDDCCGVLQFCRKNDAGQTSPYGRNRRHDEGVHLEDFGSQEVVLGKHGNGSGFTAAEESPEESQVTADKGVEGPESHGGSLGQYPDHVGGGLNDFPFRTEVLSPRVIHQEAMAKKTAAEKVSPGKHRGPPFCLQSEDGVAAEGDKGNPGIGSVAPEGFFKGFLQRCGNRHTGLGGQFQIFLVGYDSAERFPITSCNTLGMGRSACPAPHPVFSTSMAGIGQ